ncbi:hypothetical protein SGLAM104S_08602 [Streptomyces glaucescens]
MEKVNAPATGWLSAETTWYDTVYVPSGSPGRSFTVYVAPVPRASPVSARPPLGSSTRSAWSDSATVSEKVSEICSGAWPTTAPCRGSLLVSAACAKAGRRIGEERGGDGQKQQHQAPDARGDGLRHGVPLPQCPE